MTALPAIMESDTKLEELNNVVVLFQEIFGILIIIVNFVTGFAYVLTWSTQSLAGRVFAHMLISRALHLLSYGVIVRGKHAGWSEIAPTRCIIISFIHQFLWMSEYSWLLTVNFDFWRCFKTLTPPRQNNPLDKTKSRKYLKYFLFAEGTPFLIVSVCLTAYLALVKRNKHDLAEKLIPNFGGCSVSRSAMIIYVIPLITIFVIASFIYATLTYCAIKRHRSDTEFVRLAKDKKDDLSNFELFCKLSVLMGVNWMIEFIVGITLVATIDRDSSQDNIPFKFSPLLVYSFGALFLILVMFGSAVTVSVIFLFKNKTVTAQLRWKFAWIFDKVSAAFPLSTNGRNLNESRKQIVESYEIPLGHVSSNASASN